MTDHASKSRLQWSIFAILVCLLIIYVGSYVVLSRQGFADADVANCDGFYFFPPEETDAWRSLNYNCVRFYYPLIFIDIWIGTGRYPASEPMWNLS